MKDGIEVECIYQGKTKDVYRIDENHVLLKFKDDMTGVDGVFDPGANTVGLKMEGAGKTGLRISEYFFKKCIEEGIPTHFVEADIQNTTMKVKDAEMFGKGLEFICRFRAVGSFYRRYGSYCKEGQPLQAFVEVTLKDDKRNDPPITKDGLVELGILTNDEYDIVKEMTKKVANIVGKELDKKGLELYDIKFEFGRDKKSGDIMLIDEISGGNMRVYGKDGEYVNPLELAQHLFS